MEKKKFIVNARKYKGDTSILSLRLASELIEKYDNLSVKTGRTRNELMSLALEFAIDNLEVK